MQHLALVLAALATAIAVPAAAQEVPETALEETQGAENPEAPLVIELPSPEMTAALNALDIAPVFDGHNDMPLQLRARFDNQINDLDFTDTSRTGETHRDGRAMHTDLNRLREGRVGAQFWAIWVPTSLTEPQAVQMTIEQIDVTKRLIARYPEELRYAETADEVEAAMADGRIASILGVEGGHSIGSSLAVLRQLYALGARYMTITHMTNTPWADSAIDDAEHNGLTDFGKDVIREMNRLGMVVDLSHVTPKVMHDTLDIAKAPVIFSHSGAKGVTGHARNVPDDVLLRLPDNGGIVMVVALPGFLNEERRLWFAEWRAQEAKHKSLFQGQPDAIKAAMDAWEAENPEPVTMITHMADHIDHIRDLIGVEYIGIGGDFDGIPSGPVGFEDVSGYAALFAELAKRGYSQVEMELIASRNAMRVLREAERHAASVSNQPPIETVIPTAGE